MTLPSVRGFLPCIRSEPLNDTTQVDYELATLKQRRARLRQLAATEAKEPMSLTSSQRHLLRRDGSPSGLRSLDRRLKALKRRAANLRSQRRSRDSALNRHKRPPFLSNQRDRFFHPLANRAHTPGPGAHKLHTSIVRFGAAAATKAPGFGASQRLPLANARMHSGLSTLRCLRAFFFLGAWCGVVWYVEELTNDWISRVVQVRLRRSHPAQDQEPTPQI